MKLVGEMKLGKGANMISGEKGNNGLIYVEVALSQIPRLLSLMDRKKGSKAYGCGGRYYWRYKLIDFPSAYFQIPPLSLYTPEYPNNIYYKHPKVKDWAIAAMEFLTIALIALYNLH
jgi:hypothetical protein